MMKTSDEIKKGLEACGSDECHGHHTDCPYEDDFFCTMHICGDARAYIQQLERERDAAVKQLKDVDTVDLFCCSHCKHEELCDYNINSCDDCEKDCPCHTCVDMCNWQWRGVQEGE